MLRLRSARGQAGQSAIETALLLPILGLLMFGAFQVGRLFYIFNTLHKGLKSGVHYLQRTQGTNFCDANDPAVSDAKNFIVFGNLQGTGTQLVNGLTADMIDVIPERSDPTTGAINSCPCGGDGSCDIVNGGTPPDFVTVSLGVAGYPLDMRMPFVHWGIVPVHVSVRLPFLGA